MPPSHRSDPTSTAFLVERYLPATASNGLAASVARVASLCTDAEGAGTGVQYLHSAYLPSEDTCFCVFRAASADDVRRVNGAASFAFDRITDAVVLLPGVVEPRAATHPSGPSVPPPARSPRSSEC